MLWKMLKYGVVASVGAVLIGGLLFGGDLVSYVRSSAKSVRSSVKDSVPLSFELRRARDLLDEIIPEMQANVRLIAQEEVEVAELKTDIERSQRSLGAERTRVARLRETLSTQQASFTVGDFTYSRQQLKEDLARRFDLLKEAEVVLAGKSKLLESRNKSLQAAMSALEKTRSQKSLLESQIEGLDAQYRLVQATSVGAGAGVQIDSSKLAQTEKLIAQIKKQLDVAERVLAHESKFTQPVQIDAIDEKDLLVQVDEHLNGKEARPAEKLSRAGER